MSLVSCQLSEIPEMTWDGSEPARFSVVYLVETRDKVDALTVLSLAQDVNEIPPGSTPVPYKGDPFDYTYQASEAYHNNSEVQYSASDPYTFAMDFQVSARQGMANCWMIRVGYRPPQLGQDEHPLHFYKRSPKQGSDQTNNGELILVDGNRQYNLPEDRPPEAWLEYFDGQRPEPTGYYLNPPSSGWPEQEERTTLAKGNGEPAQVPYVSALRLIYVVQYNVTSQQVAAQINKQYENTVNDRDMWLKLISDGTANPPNRITVLKGQCRFLRAEQTRQYERGWDRSVVTVRFEIDFQTEAGVDGDDQPTTIATGHLYKFANEGSYVLDVLKDDKGNPILSPPITGQEQWVPYTPVDSRGQPVSPPYPLNYVGEWVHTQAKNDPDSGASKGNADGAARYWPDDDVQRYRIYEYEDYTVSPMDLWFGDINNP